MPCLKINKNVENIPMISIEKLTNAPNVEK
jgi:hypothetical protein